MSWIQRLYETYNHCESMIGTSSDEKSRPLLPICHIVAQADIEITLDIDGNFRRTKLITDRNNDASTIIPCTEASASRAGSKPSNHPLGDKLQYVAGDFLAYGGAVTSGFLKKPEEPYQNYLTTLKSWANSEFGHPRVKSIVRYVEKGRVIKDLVEAKIFLIDENNRLLTKKDYKGEKNENNIFSVVNNQGDAFIRWNVETPGKVEPPVWGDESIWESWVSYYLSTQEKEAVCLITGEEAVLTSNHPKYIRARGDGAKIISANDSSGFTFRGRFNNDYQAFSVGLEVSQKAHNALIWLIDKQGKVLWERSGSRNEPGLTVVAWANSTISIPQPLGDTDDFLGLRESPPDEFGSISTAQNFAKNLNLKMQGYKAQLSEAKDIQVLVLDAATKGRLSVVYYRELLGEEYWDRLEAWHRQCSWIHTYKYDVEADKHFTFVGAPAPVDIAEAAYGSRLDDNLKKATVKRLLPCIIDGQQIPRDLVESTVRRASNRISMENWEWNKTLSIACALVKKYYETENYQMTLDIERKTRDYLYGRLLALADNIEEWALSEAGEKRGTNAARLMQRFSERPYTTWETIELSLAPSKARLGRKAGSRLKLMDEIMSMFDAEDFINDKRLSGEFLLGYHCQRDFLRNQFGKKADESQSEEEE